jgi:hypothetical protein
MSPIGEAGINLAIQDTVAAAHPRSMLALRRVTDRDLAAVQRRRMPQPLQHKRCGTQRSAISPVLPAGRPAR